MHAERQHRCGLHLTALPTVRQYGGHSVEAVTGVLELYDQALAEIPAGGFDLCP